MDLILDKVSKRFKGCTAVDDVSMEMASGVYGLLGANGAGKTTLMRMICTILRPDVGSIVYRGEDIFEMDRRYRDLLGYLPQEFGFYPELTVVDYLKYIAALKGLRRGAAAERISDLLAVVGMADNAHKKMKQLSGGMKRRVGIAQSLLNDPRVLILDEPTSGLDPMERIRFRDLIGQLGEERTVLLSTHIVSDIEAIAKEVFLMKQGRIISQGSIAALCDEISGKSWICRSDKKEAMEVINRQDTLVVTMRSEGSSMEYRILCGDKPCENAMPSEVTLEDVFIYHFGESEDRGNAQI